MPEETQTVETPFLDTYRPQTLYAPGSDGVTARDAAEEARLRELGFVSHDEIHAAQLTAEREELARATAAEEERLRLAEIKAQEDERTEAARKAQEEQDAAERAKGTPQERQWAFEMAIKQAQLRPKEEKLIRLTEIRRGMIDQIAFAARTWGEVTEEEEKQLVSTSAEIRQLKTEIEKLRVGM